MIKKDDLPIPPPPPPPPIYDIDPQTAEQIGKSFTFHPPIDRHLGPDGSGEMPAGKHPQGPRYVHMRDLCGNAARQIATLAPPSRERSLALTKLEEAVFWANAAIARNE